MEGASSVVTPVLEVAGFALLFNFALTGVPCV